MEPDSSSPTPPESQQGETPVVDTPGSEQPYFNEDNFADKGSSMDSAEPETGTAMPASPAGPMTDSATTPPPPSPDVVTSTTPSPAPMVGTIASAPKKKSRKVLLIILVVVILIVAGLVIYTVAMG